MRKSRFLSFAFQCFVIVLFGTVAAFADMIITTRDGKQYSVPVNARDVMKIEYTDTRPGGADERGLFEGWRKEGVRYHGCFRDQGGVGTAGRDLSGFAIEDRGMTNEKCVSICQGKGFRYAGTQAGSWCFCGNSFGRSGKADNCNMKCGGNRDDICGGDWANSVYEVR
ncbi:exported hypothetical protein [Candidatus Sulfobium mesophilum]|uniref:WSC domain-containing protein n=1 Tax=Candidatus Sulfobium mesophilum TaxID=2016548 RepID=A0A2U3QHK2_9BACT|nr:exported hypothetical protein [Candidatus Sulfobium mesophilum]